MRPETATQSSETAPPAALKERIGEVLNLHGFGSSASSTPSSMARLWSLLRSERLLCGGEEFPPPQ